uniref:FYN binding protein n=1 Tax=Rhipicephalus appendiculatus TaxID=34631 RepID=A0A131YGL3_RHIAP
MRDEQAGQALASPRSNVKTLRELFNDKDARSTPRVASVKRPTEVRIPRPSLAPKPPNNRKDSVDSAKETSSPAGGFPKSRGASSTRRASFEHGRVPPGAAPSQQAPPGATPSQQAPPGAAPSQQAPSRVVPSQQEPPRAVSSSDLREDSPSPKAVVDRPASASCEAPCEEEEDYETPISLSKPPEPPRRETVASSQPRCEEVCLPKPVEGSSQRTKPKLPEPPLYVPAQFVHHPVVSGWLRRKLPTATACPPKPVRPSGMRLLHSSLQNIAPSAAQLDRPLPPNRSPLPLAPPNRSTPPPVPPNRSTPPPAPPAPPSRAPPPRPSVPKPPRMLPSLPTTAPADDACSEPRPPTSPIPEYTEDEELGSMEADDEPYADTEMDDETPPSLPPARTVPPQPQDDALYDDTLEELYEEMPTEEIAPPPPLKVLDNLPKKDKQEHDNVCKTFGLPSGWERLQPVDAGHARTSSTGGGTKNLDLPLQRGEPVYVLRFENNPPGKWLVRNHQGEVGYADLMNIEIMTTHRSPCASLRKQQTSAMECEEEAIYEETF